MTFGEEGGSECWDVPPTRASAALVGLFCKKGLWGMVEDMGFDGIDGDEIFWAVEKYFEISLPEDLGQATTLGELADCVAGVLKAEEGGGEVCLSARAFYRTRRVLGSLCGVDPRGIRRETMLESIIGGKNVREIWAGLRGEMEGLDALELPKWCLWVAIASTLMWFVFWAYLRIVSGIRFAGLMALGFAPVGVGLVLMLQMFFGRIPRRYETAGLLSASMIPRVAKELKGDKTFHRDEVWMVVRSLMAELAGEKAEELRRETKIWELEKGEK